MNVQQRPPAGTRPGHPERRERISASARRGTGPGAERSRSFAALEDDGGRGPAVSRRATFQTLLAVALGGLTHAGGHVASARAAWRDASRAPAANPFGATDRVIEAAIAAGNAPGAVLCVGRAAGVVYLKSYGRRAVRPAPAAMTDDTVFDLASLTKPVATATSVMILAERGELALADKVAKHLPAFAAGGKGEVTVEHLLLHRGSVIADTALSDFADGPELAIRRQLESEKAYEPGAKFVYSDVGYMVLAELVRVVAGRPVNEFARAEVFDKLKMAETCFLPPDELKARCAPTEARAGKFTPGEVHDPRAFALGGVAGHAGLFGTAADLARYCRMMLKLGELDGARVMTEATARAMTLGRPLPDGTGVRGYGFDVDTSYSSPRGERFAKGASFGHTGFTGTSLWVDPAADAFVVLLTNAVHPDGKGKVVALRRDVSTAAADALAGAGAR